MRLIKYRAEQIDENGEPISPQQMSGDPGRQYESTNREMVTHWIFHEQMYAPEKRFQIVRIIEEVQGG